MESIPFEFSFTKNSGYGMTASSEAVVDHTMGGRESMVMRRRAAPFAWSPLNPNELAVVNTRSENVIQIKSSTPTVTESMRKLYCESHGVFRVQQDYFVNSKHINSREVRTRLLQSSRHYRAILRVSFESAEVGEKRVLRWMEICWHLGEILFIAASRGAIISPLLIQWFRSNFSDEPSREERFSMDTRDEWSSLYKFVLHGKMEDARKAFKRITDSRKGLGLEDSHCEIIEGLLVDFPTLGIGQPADEFYHRWQSWKDNCRHARSLMRVVPRQVQVLVELLNGDEGTLTQESDNWVELMISKILFKEPIVKPFDLQTLAVSSNRAKPMHTTSDDLPLFELLSLLVTGNIPKAITKSVKVFSNYWFAVHMSDLLRHTEHELHSTPLLLWTGGRHTDVPPIKTRVRGGMDIREFLLLRYVEQQILCESSLYGLGLEYYGRCMQFGKEHSAELVSRVPIRSERHACKLLAHGRAHYVREDVLHTIRKVVGMSCVMRGRYSSALWWFAQAQDSIRLSTICRVLVEKEALTTHHLTLLTDNLPPDLLSSSSLSFLHTYKLLLHHWERHEYSAAWKVGVSLVTDHSTHVPLNVWRSTFKDILLPILKRRDVLFSMDELHKVQATVEENELSFIRKDTCPDVMAQVRLHLVHALAHVYCTV